MSLEKTTALIKGLADVVKNQQQLQNTAIQKTADQLQTLSDTVANLAQNLSSTSPSLIQSNGLRLPNLILPIYAGREHIMTVPLVCIVAVIQHTTACPVIATGDTCTNMSETGFAVALNVFVSNPSSPLMASCNLGYTSTLFTPFVSIMLVNFLLPIQVKGGYSLQNAHILVTFVLSQFLTKQPQLQLMCYFMTFSSN